MIKQQTVTCWMKGNERSVPISAHSQDIHVENDSNSSSSSLQALDLGVIQLVVEVCSTWFLCRALHTALVNGWFCTILFALVFRGMGARKTELDAVWAAFFSSLSRGSVSRGADGRTCMCSSCRRVGRYFMHQPLHSGAPRRAVQREVPAGERSNEQIIDDYQR